jgi:GH24 family phage-related lysozyme (muramidase)
VYAANAETVDLVASFEGFVDGVYNDSSNNATGGFGHLIHLGPVTPTDEREYAGHGKAFWLSLFHEDIQRVAIGPMNEYLHVPLNQPSVSAVASATYNCGPGFVEGTVGHDINEREWLPAANAFMLWANPSVLTPRREQERALFLRGVNEKPTLPFPWLEAYERKAVLEYDKLLSANRNKPRRVQLRVEMTAYRKLVWEAASRKGSGGWDVHHRRQRYRTLWART